MKARYADAAWDLAKVICGAKQITKWQGLLLMRTSRLSITNYSPFQFLQRIGLPGHSI